MITRRDGTAVPLIRYGTANIKSAVQKYGLNEDLVRISFEATEAQPFEIGDTLEAYGRRYRINRPPKVVKSGTRLFQYEVEFEGALYTLRRAVYEISVDTTQNLLQDVSGDSLTGTVEVFVRVLIANLNRLFPGEWEYEIRANTSVCKTIAFDNQSCMSALSTLCQEFDLETAILQPSGDKKVIVFREKGEGSYYPYTFQFGRGLGLYFLDRTYVDAEDLTTRLKVFGSTENISHKYRASRLCLPGKSKSESYIEKAEPVNLYGLYEAIMNLDDIKPTFDGEVTAVVSGAVTRFVDSSMFDLNAKEADGVTTKYLISGTTAKIHFNTGNLSGYEFDVSGYDHATRTFTLVPFTDERGDVFPSESSAAFQIQPGDQYKILDVILPDQYLTAAEERLAEEAEIQYERVSQPRVKYDLKITPDFLQEITGDTAPNEAVFLPGDYIQIKDSDIGVDKAIRAIEISRNLLNDYEYTLGLSDFSGVRAMTSILRKKMEQVEKVIKLNKLNDPARARANWRSSRELLNMVFDPEGDYFTEKIKPASIDTALLSVGAKSMQFTLVDTIFESNYGGDRNKIGVSGGVLTHYAIEEHTRDWQIQGGVLTCPDDQKAYYLYARCHRTGANAVLAQMVVSTEEIKVTQDANYYHFLVGIVNSVDPDIQERAISLMYGFTTISGSFIRTGRIESMDSSSYFDLSNNAFRIGNEDASLSYNVDADGKLVLKGTMVQSPAGDTDYVEVDRGNWSATTVYYPGDKVAWQGEVYKCTQTTAAGLTPASAAFWKKLVAKGADGKQGKDGADGQPGNRTLFAYKYAEEQPAPPTGDIPADGWFEQATPTYTITHRTETDIPLTHTGDWVLQEDGTRKSPTIGDDQITKNRISFTSTKPNQELKIHLRVSSERGFDFALVGKLDNAGLTINSNYTERISDMNEVEDITIVIPTVGEHFVEVAYAKDSSRSAYQDCAWYSAKLIDVTVTEEEVDNTGEPVWMSTATQDWKSGAWVTGAWSTPVRVTGEDGEPGKDGNSLEFIYRLSDTQPATPTNAPTDAYVPSGWTDRPSGVDATHEQEWASQRYKRDSVWGAFSTPALWAKWGIKGQDGDGVEYIYKRTTTEAVPATPGTSQTPNFVPSGWTNNPTGVTTAAPYEYVSIRRCVSGVWGGFSTPALWAKYGKDGAQGAAGTSYKFAYYASDSTTAPAAPTTPGTIPSSWKATAEKGSYKYVYMSQCVQTTGTWGSWSAPVRITGEDGETGKDGKSIEFIFRRTSTASQPATPTTSQLDSYVPSGWTNNPAGVTEAAPYEWMSVRTKATSWSAWSLPALWAKWGKDGAQGPAGAKGDTGATGAKGADGTSYMYAYYASDSITPPATPSSTGGAVPSGWSASPNKGSRRYVYVSQRIQTGGTWGSWSAPTHYIMEPEAGSPGPAIVFRGRGFWHEGTSAVCYNNAVRRDVFYATWTNNTRNYYIYKGQDGKTLSQFNDADWENFGAQFESIATGLLLAENANIAGWIFKNQRLESQAGGAFLDGKTGEVSITGKFQTAASGKRVIINPDTSSLEIWNGSSKVGSIGYSTSDNYPLLRLDSADFQKVVYLSPSVFSIVDSSSFTVTTGGTKTYVTISSLPTSPDMLSAGAIWRDGTTLKIKT